MVANSLPARLKEERKRLGMNQEEIAQKVSVKRETWSRYETGKIKPGSAVLLRGNSLGLDVPYIMTGIRTKQIIDNKELSKSSALKVSEDQVTYNPLKLTKKEHDLIRCYRTANDEGKKTIDDIIKLLTLQQGNE